MKSLEELTLNDAVLVLRDAIFFEDYIFIRQFDDNIIITKEDILYIDYNKPSFFHWLIAATSRAYLTPGYLWIGAKVKLEGKKKLKNRQYFIKIKYEEVFKLPAKFQPDGWCQ